jgi:D-glycero-alpha-D-manno-heptose 1-phosphate guanylyltransferase
MKNIDQVIVLAGGLGTRLRSAVPDLPKCMAPVNGKPFIGYVIDYFQKQGVENFIFALGYKSEMFEGFISTKISNDHFQVSVEDEPLGTGGAVKLACSKALQENVLIANGDTLFKINVAILSGFHLQNNADCTLSLKFMQGFDRYGVVEIATDYRVSNFKEKKYYAEGNINGGVYALNVANFLNKNLPGKFSFEKDYLEKYFDDGKIFGVEQDAYFIDIGIPEDYQKAATDFNDVAL